MKTTVKTITIASIIALGTASAFAKPAAKPVEPGKGNGPAPAVELPKKVADRPEAKPSLEKESKHEKIHENRKRHVAGKNSPRTEHRPDRAPSPVAKREGPRSEYRHHARPSAAPKFSREHRSNHRPAEFRRSSSRHAPFNGPSVKKNGHKNGPRPEARTNHRRRQCR